MNEKTANRILDLIEYSDYEIIAIYESSFKAIRKNEYMLSELNVDVIASNLESINRDNVFNKTSICIHVLKRYN